MSVDGDEQSLTLTAEEASTLRGAMNIATEVLDLPGQEATEEFPINRGQVPIIRRVRDRLERRLEADVDELNEVLDPQEAQALRDVAGLVEVLLEDRGKRPLLVEIGWLADVDQNVSDREREVLATVRQMVDPTGVRPDEPEPIETDFPEGGLRDVDVTGAMRDLLGTGDGAVINPDLSVTANIEQMGERISAGDAPWPDNGLEVLEGLIDERDATCREGELALAAAAVYAVGGHRQMQTDQTVAGRLPTAVDGAMTDAMSVIESNHCVSRDAQHTLWDRIDDLTNRLTPGVTHQNVVDSAQQLLVDLRAVVDEPTDMTTVEGDSERLLGHIDQLRANLEESLTSFPITDEEPLQETIIESRPASNAACEDYLVSLAELAVIAGRLESGREHIVDPDTEAQFVSRFDAMRQRVQHERRLLFDRMGLDAVVVDEPLPTPRRECADQPDLRRLRNSFTSILDPLADDPDDVETRAFAAISDIREFFMDPRRGP